MIRFYELMILQKLYRPGRKTFIMHISPLHSHHHCSHHLSLPQPFTTDLKLLSFTNPFLHSLSGSFWTAFMDLEPVPN